MYRASPGARGCGEARTQGGVYIECGLSPGVGLPVESFLYDPPEPWPNLQAAIGVEILEVNGVYHVFDIVGSKHYPSPADIIEEIKRMGMSRKVSPGLDWGKLTEKSRVILLHSRAVITNLKEVKPWEKINPNIVQAGACKCARLMKYDALYKSAAEGREHLNDFTIPCIAYHWMLHTYHDPDEKTRAVGKAFNYPVWYPNGGFDVAPQFELGIIANMPITGISVIESQDGSHVSTLDEIKAQTNIWTRQERE